MPQHGHVVSPSLRSCCCFTNVIASYLNLSDPVLIILLAIGVAFYIPLGSRRGYVQGAYGFRRLASSLVIEGMMRLGGSVLLILLGFGVRGVIAANSAAVITAYFAITPKLAARIPTPIRRSYALREMAQTLVFFSGQVLINNCDIVLVKHFFLLREAGLYAAVAMVGRVVFSFSQAIVNSMFPLVGGRKQRGKERSYRYRFRASHGVDDRLRPRARPAPGAELAMDDVLWRKV